MSVKSEMQCDECQEYWKYAWANMPFKYVGSYILRSPLGFGVAICDTCDKQATVLIMLQQKKCQPAL